MERSTIFHRSTIYKWAIYTMAMLNNQRVDLSVISHRMFPEKSHNHPHKAESPIRKNPQNDSGLASEYSEKISES